MKSRRQIYLEDDLAAQLDIQGGKAGASKSAVVADALRFFWARRAAGELDDLLTVRLDRMTRSLARIERDQKILLESLALFIRYQLTVTAPLPETDRAAQAVGRERFQRFVDQVGRQLAQGRETFSANEEGVA